MEQLKSYLSQLPKLNKVLLLSSTDEFGRLADWLKKTGKAREICCMPAEAEHTIGEDVSQSGCGESGRIDAVIFDYGCGKELSALTTADCTFLIGRMRKAEDYFRLWESWRTRAKRIYLERDKEIEEKEVTPDRAACEILFWEKGETEIELSVIIPVYNVAAYLPECIDSLIRWKAPYVEYLFVNDGSTDTSAEVIADYAKQDKRIRLINKENGGCASARNKGIEEAEGSYIGFVDSDDFLEETMFQKLFSRVIMGNYDLAYCGYSEYNEETEKSRPVLNDCLQEPYVEGTWRQDKVWLLAIKTRVAIWRCIYRKKMLMRAGIRFHEELKRFDDLPFRVEVLFTAKSAVCVPEYLYYYRLGRDGQDVACRDDRLFVHFPIFEGLDSFVKSLGDKRLEDLLQVVKLHTHGYALSRIEKKYKKGYIRLARQQLDQNMGYVRTLCLILMYTGKGNLGWYTRMKVLGLRR